MRKKIIIACGAGLATSTMITEKVKKLLDENNIDYDITQSQIYELENYDQSADLFITTMKVEEEYYKTPVVVGTSFVMGINEEETKKKILEKLTN